MKFNQVPTFSQDIRSTIPESPTSEDHKLSSVCWNHEKFIPLEGYFDEEDDGIG
jgi:hypothetical protein